MKFPLTSSAKSLIVSNVIITLLAIVERWNIGSMLVIFWWQSVIIGFFQFLKIWNLTNFTTKGLKSNGKQVEATKAGKYSIAVFFAIHYGIFHQVYAAFIFSLSSPVIDMSVFGSVLLLFINHYISYRRYRATEHLYEENLGGMMFWPYARVLPMHLFLIFGSVLMMASSNALVAGVAIIFFMLLKTASDVFMEMTQEKIEHGKVSSLKEAFQNAHSTSN